MGSVQPDSETFLYAFFIFWLELGNIFERNWKMYVKNRWDYKKYMLLKMILLPKKYVIGYKRQSAVITQETTI